ncbi:MAG TPA: class I SAM-dependent methyltransferase [Anaerolineales bacterium]|nr:class I SAM-dependent methyltransferase [Anaerolineales bacterium]
MQNLLRRLEFQSWYFRRPPWDTGVSPPELIEFIETHEPGRAIDIGCGTGTNVITLFKAGWRVTGVDFAPHAIKLAKQKMRQAGVQAELHVRDATKLQGISGPFDLAFDLGCFHGIPPDGQRKYLEQLDRILAAGGFWLLYTFLKPETDDARSGLAEANVEQISSQLTLLSRRDGIDDGRAKPSAWFLFKKN